MNNDQNKDGSTALLNDDTPQNNNPNPVSLNNIYPDPNRDKVVINNGLPQNQNSSFEIGIDANKKNDKNKKFFILLTAGLVVLIGIIVAIFGPKIFEPNKADTKEVLNSIELNLPFAIDYCKRVRDDVEEHSLKRDLYEMKVDSCKNSVITLYGFIDKLGSVGNAEKQEAFNSFKTSLDTNLPSPDQLEDTLKAYVAMYDFNVALFDFKMGGKSLDYRGDEFINAVSFFTDSSNDELVQFGNGVKQLYSELFDDWRQFTTVNEMGENDPAKLDKYLSTEKNFYNYIDDNKPNISSLYLLANDENGEISNAFSNFMNKI